MTLKAEIKNFTETELRCKCCKLFNMSDQHLINLQALRYRYGLPLAVTSGCRCMKHNGSVGGVPNSRHQASTKEADATDLTCNDLPALYHVAKNIGLFKEVIWYAASGFIHVSSYPDKPGIYYGEVDK